ncbi:MAG: DUF3105 domain-containing protein, partial [Thermoleophilia bacterium]|nr:DUF3105 domain-containing protein [Thermoleophilia bacterium]
TTPSTRDSASQRRLLYILAATGVVALAVVLGVIFLAGGDDEDIAAAMEAGGCQLKTAQAQVGNHSAKLDATTNPKWNTDPPTSGPHWPVPAVYGEYDTPLKPAQFVHNLEHGAIFILYGPDVPQATVQQLRDFYNDDQRGLLLAPYTKLKDKIALGAWTVPDDFEPGGKNGTAYLATCSKFDEDAFSTFRDELRFRGPERFPPDSLQPGTP